MIMKKILSISALLLLLAVTAFAQGLTVRGVVVDEDNVPMIGVGVLQEGTTNGTLTDMDGKFSFKVPDRNVKINFSFLGYNSLTLPFSDQPMRVVLTPESNTLDDVVVVAYGVQRRESVVGSIASVSSEELKQMGTPNLSTALAGKVAGITFTLPSGRPGDDDAKLYVRGVSTFSGDSSPLVLVDGVERDYSSVDPEDIAQLSVLKDASATAVYGVRGANGAILITTKRGTKGAPKFNVNYTFSLQQPTRMPTFLGSYEHAILRNEALANEGGVPSFSQEQIDHYKLGDDPYLYPDNDYVNDFVRKFTPMHKLNVGVRGGSDMVRYYVALSGLSQDGIYKQFDGRYPSNANSKRLNLRANLDFALTKTTDLTLDLNGRLQQRQNNSQGLSDNSLFQMMYETPPMAYPYLLPDGSYGASSKVSAENLLAMLSDWGYTRLMTNVLEGTVKLNQRLDFITTGLNARASVSFNSYYDTGTKVSYRPPTYEYKGEGVEKVPIDEETAPGISSLAGDGHRQRINVEAGLEYNRTFQDHALGGLLLYTLNRSHANANLPQAFLGYAARATYAYKSTYLIEVNCGYNGSDQFAKAYRYALFPSFALGYVLTNSPFLKDNPVLTSAKIRASYGMVGNDKIGSDRFIYLQTYSKSGDAYFFGKDDAFGGQASLTEGDMGNEHVTWEIGKKTNLGIDMTFMKDLDVDIDLFDEHRENIFTSRNTTPKTLGISSAKENIGRVMNRGFEVELRYRHAIGRDFSYNVGGMVSYSRNKVLYKDEVEPKYEYLRQTGKPINQFFGWTVLRYYTPDDFILDGEGNRILDPALPQPQYPVQPGDFMYKDLNDDKVIDTYDKGPIGLTPVPALVYNFNATVRYKGFDFNIMFQGAGLNSKLMTKSMYEPVREENRFQTIHLYRWTEDRWRDGEKILYPRLSAAQNNHNQATNTFFLKRGDYLRLKNIELGYTFSKRQLAFFGLSSARVYVSGNNVYTWSEIKNFDPEMGNSNGYFYPQLKLWNAGVNINF